MRIFNAFFIAATALPGAAFAQPYPQSTSLPGVEIYGRLDASVNSVRIDKVGTVQTVSSDTSYIGFRGVEDLGGGLLAYFKMESQLAIDSGNSGGTLNLGNGAASPVGTPTPQFFNRESHVGLKSERYGQVSLGTHWAPEIYISARTDPFIRGQMGGHFTLLQGTGSRGYAIQFVNSVQYLSPTIGGFSGRFIAQAPEGSFTKNYGALVDYSSDRLYAGLGFDSAQANLTAAALGVTPSTRSANLGLGAAYRFDALRLSGYVQQNRVSGLATVTGYDVGVSIPVGQGEIRSSVSHTNNPGKEATLFAVGYNYYLSKRTQLYTTVARLNNGAGARFAMWPASQDGAATSAGGQNIQGVQVGIRHFF